MNRKVLCLQTLLSKSVAHSEILNFLIESKTISVEEAQKLNLESDIPLALHVLLEKLKKADKLQLLDYEWQILPKERIVLLIVTEYDRREFVYNQ